MDEQTSVQLIQALANVWTAIRDRHPDVPGVVLIPAPAQRGRTNVLGHFAPLRWRTRESGGHLLHEVVVVAEHLDRSAEDIVETLVHEAAHAMNFARGVRDCTASQYHNKKFKAAAEELGLEVTQVKHYGFALTRLLPGTVERYRSVTSELDQVLVHRQRLLTRPRGPRPGGSGAAGNGDGSPSRSRKATCACAPPFIIRVSKRTIEDTVIRCESCEEPFNLV